jgi:predicted enzyme related to lactoylglutathione lyase
MANAISWVEFPVNDFQRAVKFYSTILEGEIEEMEFPEGKMGFLPGATPDGVGAAVIKWDGYTPSTNGTCAYLNGGEDLSKVLNRVEKAGGEVVMPKTDTGKNGFVAQFIDTEGNRVGLYSTN